MSTNGVSSGTGGGKTAAAGNKPLQNQATVGAVTPSGNGNVGISSNHIIQYPRQPKRDDGKWLAIGSLLGTLVGKFASQGVIDKAKDAETKWRVVNDTLFDRGKRHFADGDSEWDSRKGPEAELEGQAGWFKDRRDDEYDYGNSLNPCNDAIHAKLCAFVQCGYKADYRGISERAIATAEAAILKERKEVRKQMNRYAWGECCDTEHRLATAKIMAVVGTVAQLREAERQKAFDTNTKLLFDGAELMEKHRQSRISQADRWAQSSVGTFDRLYNYRVKNAHDLWRIGGDMLSAAGRNYGWLADSLRKTADKDMAGMASLGSLIALLIAMFACQQGKICGDDDSGGTGNEIVDSGNAGQIF